MDTAQAIAEKLGLELQIDDMDFDAALLSVQQARPTSPWQASLSPTSGWL